MKIAVRGKSMLPVLSDGDEIEIRLCDPAEARPGDVVLVRDGDLHVVHRLLARRGDRVLTQGDAVRWADPPIPSERLLGVARIPRRPVLAFLRLLRASLGAAAHGTTWYGRS